MISSRQISMSRAASPISPMSRRAMLTGAIAALAMRRASSQARTSWHAANAAELEAALPSRALVGKERIETEIGTATGIVNDHGQIIAAVVLITAGVRCGREVLTLPVGPGSLYVGRAKAPSRSLRGRLDALWRRPRRPYLRSGFWNGKSHRKRCPDPWPTPRGKLPHMAAFRPLHDPDWTLLRAIRFTRLNACPQRAYAQPDVVYSPQTAALPSGSNGDKACAADGNIKAVSGLCHRELVVPIWHARRAVSDCAIGVKRLHRAGLPAQGAHTDA